MDQGEAGRAGRIRIMKATCRSLYEPIIRLGLVTLTKLTRISSRAT